MYAIRSYYVLFYAKFELQKGLFDLYISFDKKKQVRILRARFLAVLIPFFQFNVVVYALYWVNNSIFYNYAANELIVKILYVGITLTLILLAGVIVYSILLIKAHKINTFAEIYSNTLVISVFSQA